MHDSVSLTRALLAQRTVNPPGDEEPCAAFLARMLEAAGFQVVFHRLAPNRASLIARLAGSGEDAPLCFTGHLDTVPLGETPWGRDPFAGEFDGDLLFGRGSTDMKGGVAAMVWAALRAAEKPRRRAGLTLVLTADEEVGCRGARALVEAGVPLGGAGALVVGEPTANLPLLGHKGALWLEIETRGRAAHGSMPHLGDNAIFKAAEAILALRDFSFDSPAHPLLGLPTLNVGTVSGGARINIVPDQARLEVDIRTLPDQDHDAMTGALQALLGPEAIIRDLGGAAGVMSDAGHPWIVEVSRLMEGVLGRSLEPACAPYVTDASILTPALGAPPTLILGPGDPEMAHKVDEYCRVSRIVQSAEVYLEIMRRWEAG